MRMVRPYALTYAWKYLLGLAFLLVSSFFMFRLFFYGWWGDVIYALGMAIGFYCIFHAVYISRNNILVLTTARAVDIQRLGWFDELISSISYLDVKDIAIRKKGVWQSLFNFGGIAITTKSEQLVLEFFGVYNPVQIQGLVFDLAQQYKQHRKVANMHAIYNNFIKIIPDLPDGELQEVKRLINEQLGPSLSGKNNT